MQQQVITVGLNHRTAPMHIREQVAFSKREAEDLLLHLTGCGCCQGAVVLSTCNRTELYLCTDQQEDGLQLLKECFERHLKNCPEEYIYTFQGQEAARHLFQVAAGLDSLIQGEDQILGQVKQAYELAAASDCCSTYLHELFNLAIKTGKRARSETGINRKSASIASAAVEMLTQKHPNLNRAKVLVVGAGKMGRILLENLHKTGIDDVTLTNRTASRAENLAAGYGYNTVTWADRFTEIQDFDVIISLTGSADYIMEKGDLPEPFLTRGETLYLFDLAVPRDIDPVLGEINGIDLIILDDLQKLVAENVQFRAQAEDAVAEIIADECQAWQDWCKAREAAPFIKKLGAKADTISRQEQLRFEQKANQLTARQEALIQQMGSRITNRLLHHPRVKLKEILQRTESKEEREKIIALAAELFGLEI